MISYPKTPLKQRISLPKPAWLYELPITTPEKWFQAIFPKKNLNLQTFGKNYFPFLGLNALSNSQKSEDVKRFQNILSRNAKFEKNASFISNKNRLEMLKVMADLGDPDSMYEYSQSLIHSQNPDFYSECLKYFRVASLMNHAPSQYCYGLLLAVGDNSNIPKAYRYLRKSAENGFSEAKLLYGLSLLRLKDRNQHIKAFQLFGDAGIAGNLKAKFMAGLCVLLGIGSFQSIDDGVQIMSIVLNGHPNIMPPLQFKLLFDKALHLRIHPSGAIRNPLELCTNIYVGNVRLEI